MNTYIMEDEVAQMRMSEDIVNWVITIKRFLMLLCPSFVHLSDHVYVYGRYEGCVTEC